MANGRKAKRLWLDGEEYEQAKDAFYGIPNSASIARYMRADWTHAGREQGAPPGLCGLFVVPRRKRMPIKPTIFRDKHYIPPAIRRALNGCVCGEKPWPLTLYGPAGCGKTCAALCLHDIAFEPAAFVDFDGLCNKVRELRRGDEERAEFDFWQQWELLNLAIVDDLGARDRASDHVYQVCKRLLDARANKPLLITTNMSLAGLETVFDDRIVSRLRAGTVVALAGDDLRETMHA